MATIILLVDSTGSLGGGLRAQLEEGNIYLEARSRQETKMLLLHEYTRLSAVVFCQETSEDSCSDGISYIRTNPNLSQLPVVVYARSEASPLESRLLLAGANDFITDACPAQALRARLNNLITLREKAATFNAFQRDRLTGLFNREVFFERASWLIRRHQPGYYVMAAFDIDGFKVINDRYGIEKGDEVLHHIAEAFRSGFEPAGGICGRIMADNFAVLYPRSIMDTELTAQIRRRASEVDGGRLQVSFSIGRYVVDDKRLAASTMYDRAVMAQLAVKGRYDTHIAMYDESMRESLLKKQKIITEMSTALKTGGFEVWYQPQYNHATGALVGAEALARWRHPVMGMVQPGDFIPLFEENGFIYELDKFVWQSTCQSLRSWLKRGAQPLPVSVNVSRYDLFREDLVEVLSSMTDKYDISPELLRLEITESAFSSDTEQIIAIVKRLIARGFTIEIDDFGSGYSSLNTLKDVPAHIIKLDMRFMEDSDSSQRSGNILESVVRMARRLGMSVIAEGMESVEQADYLKSIGCSYVQGYLYARPMPLKDYEALMASSETEQKLATLVTAQGHDNNAFWDPMSMDTLIFNSYVGGACIYEVMDGRIELLRANDKYISIIGSVGMSIEDALGMNWAQYLDEDSKALILRGLQRSVETQREVVGEYSFIDLPGCAHETWLRTCMRVIATAGERKLVYCTIENISELKIAQAGQAEAERRLEELIGDVPTPHTQGAATKISSL